MLEAVKVNTSSTVRKIVDYEVVLELDANGNLLNGEDCKRHILELITRGDLMIVPRPKLRLIGISDDKVFDFWNTVETMGASMLLVNAHDVDCYVEPHLTCNTVLFSSYDYVKRLTFKRKQNKQ